MLCRRSVYHDKKQKRNITFDPFDFERDSYGNVDKTNHVATIITKFITHYIILLEGRKV
ncbi:hypothetical protein HanXRQr2_Chr14g0656021 [Helianthus annuus]|uniref:Uncharacterized protein n=1 Tax=Helianthus annuus TaxID=4232 RepID=A0A9K3EBK1_HELAN|nr:hypothetical protein HanXRQr2_Chr14g0656021 [Helianthus annuus]